MKALILAAGLGSRLKNYTSKLPKCLLKINDKPILEYQLDALLTNGITDVIIVVGYKSELVKKFILSYKNIEKLNVRLIKNKDYSKSNSSYSFWLAKNQIVGSSYIHLHCDIIFHPDIIEKLLLSNYDNIIVVDTSSELIDGVMEQVILEKDKITKMDNRNVRNASGKGAGIAKISSTCLNWIIPRIEKYIQDGDKDQNYYTFIRDAIHYNNFYGLRSENLFIGEINTIDDLHNTKGIIF